MAKWILYPGKIGSVVSLFIFKALIKGRNLFGRPVDPNAKFKYAQQYYFDVKKLTHGDPPNDRGCRFCKSIGHKGRDCPDKKKRAKQTSRRENPHKNEPQAQSKNSTRVDTNGDVENGSDEEDSTSHHHPPRQSNENRNQMQNPEVVNRNPIPDRLPTVRVYANVRKQNPQSVPPRYQNQNPRPSAPHRFQIPLQNPTCPPMPINQEMSPLRFNAPPIAMATNAPPMNQSDNRRFVQSTANRGNCGAIHTIVFSNSKLSESSFNPIPPVSYQLPSNAEAVGPPPRFAPLNQNGQRPPNPGPFAPTTWGVEGRPFNTAQMTQAQLEFLQKYGATIAVTGPPVRPPFNNVRFTGMMGTNEQHVWRQSSPNPNQPPELPPSQVSTRPYNATNVPNHALSASLASMHINPLTRPDHSKTIQQNVTERDNQNPSTQLNFPPNNQGLNDCS